MISKIEICANSLQSALNAQKGGANRIELCDNLLEGGTTPSLGVLHTAKNLLDIDIYVLIRPRGGDFCYNDPEFQAMLQNIKYAKEIGANGIVSGILTENQELDIRRTQELIEASNPLPFTFHRAFDIVPNPFKTQQELIKLGATRILTSGQKPTAIKGASLLQQLIKIAGKQITILVGGGITAQNIQKLKNETQAPEYHFSAKSTKQTENKIPIYETDMKKVKKIVKLLKI